MSIDHLEPRRLAGQPGVPHTGSEKVIAGEEAHTIYMRRRMKLRKGLSSVRTVLGPFFVG